MRAAALLERFADGFVDAFLVDGAWYPEPDTDELADTDADPDTGTDSEPIADPDAEC